MKRPGKKILFTIILGILVFSASQKENQAKQLKNFTSKIIVKIGHSHNYPVKDEFVLKGKANSFIHQNRQNISAAFNTPNLTSNIKPLNIEVCVYNSNHFLELYSYNGKRAPPHFLS